MSVNWIESMSIQNFKKETEREREKGNRRLGGNVGMRDDKSGSSTTLLNVYYEIHEIFHHVYVCVCIYVHIYLTLTIKKTPNLRSENPGSTPPPTPPPC